MTRRPVQLILRTVAWALPIVLVAGAARAMLVPGGGARLRDCVSVLDVPGANTPPLPRQPTRIDCVDGDPSCDADGARNAGCVFTLRLCINSTAFAACTPERADGITIEHADDNGDPQFVVGGPVLGGQYGAYPQLDNPGIENEDDLRMTYDFRDYFGTVLARWLNVSTATLGPGPGKLLAANPDPDADGNTYTAFTPIPFLAP